MKTAQLVVHEVYKVLYCTVKKWRWRNNVSYCVDTNLFYIYFNQVQMINLHY